MENLEFALFYPVSICIKGKSFRYGINEGTFYPCLLGIIKSNNKIVDVISNREFNIVSEGPFKEITDYSTVVSSPANICRKIDDSLENLKFIEEYVKAKGKVSSKKIKEHKDFSNRLNKLRSIKKDYYLGKDEGFWCSLWWYESAESYFKKIDYENLKSLETISYIQSGQKDKDDLQKAKDDLVEKENIISRLKMQLLK